MIRRNKTDNAICKLGFMEGNLDLKGFRLYSQCRIRYIM